VLHTRPPKCGPGLLAAQFPLFRRETGMRREIGDANWAMLSVHRNASPARSRSAKPRAPLGSALNSSQSLPRSHQSAGGLAENRRCCEEGLTTAYLDPIAGRAITLLSGPHVDYSPPPSVGFGVGGFGFSGCCTGFGSGVGVGLPLGEPRPTHISDQYIVSAVIPVPSNYGQTWSTYRLEIQVGNRPTVLSAPAPRV
jgi:hypothetical protein